MFKVKRISDSKIFTVYSISNDNGYPSRFLIFEDSEWVWIDVKYFVPIDECNKIK